MRALRLKHIGGPVALLLCACVGRPYSSAGLYSVVMGPGFAPEGDGDGVGWDGTSAVPAELFAALAQQGAALPPEAVGDLYASYGVTATAAPWAQMGWCAEGACPSVALPEPVTEGPWVVWGESGEDSVAFRDTFDVAVHLHELDSPDPEDLVAAFYVNTGDFNDSAAGHLYDSAYPQGGLPFYVGDQTRYQILYANFWFSPGK